MTVEATSCTDTSQGSIKSVAIRPSALFSIFEQFQRRSELCSGRLIGAIFGERVRQEDKGEEVVRVLQAFPIPHSEINDQVNINSEYYRSRSELLKTCYGRDGQYVLGWYSIAFSDAASASATAATTAAATSFIHEVFCKEVNKSSPISALHSALHLKILIDPEASGRISYSIWMSERSSASGCGASALSQLKDGICFVDYDGEEAFLANALIATDFNEDANGAMCLPDAETLIKSNRSDFLALLQHAQAQAQLQQSSVSPLLASLLPDAAAYANQSEGFKSDLRDFHELLKILVDQLRVSQKLYLSH